MTLPLSTTLPLPTNLLLPTTLLLPTNLLLTKTFGLMLGLELGPTSILTS
jgi:hypothetical protein